MSESADHITRVRSGSTREHMVRRALKVARSVRAHFRRPHVARLWMFAVLSRLLIFVIGLVAVTAATHVPSPRDVAAPVSANHVANLPYRWDAEWYVSIARDGYSWQAERRGEQQSIAFFPGYPLLMRAAGNLLGVVTHVARRPALFGNDETRLLWGGVLVSIFCFALALERVHALALLDSGSAPAANRAVLLLACYPFALFLGVAYSESVTLLAVTSMALAWRRGELTKAFLWGVAAGLLRSNGWTLSCAFLIDWWFGSRRSHAPGAAVPEADRRSVGRAAAAVGPLVGLAGVCAYVYLLTGNPLEWAVAQRAWVGEPSVVTFLTRRADSIAELGLVNHLRRDTVDAIAVGCVGLMLALVIRFVARRELLYAALVVGYLTPALAIDLPAMGRLTTVLFPAFIALASMTSRVTAGMAALTFTAGQVWLAWLFFQWLPPF